jgi:hypothetical protein
MEAAIEQFRHDMVRVKNLATHAISTPELSDILRAEIVFAVSALDNFIHNMARIGLLEILQGQRSETPAYQRFQVSMETVIFCRSEPQPLEQEWVDWFDNLIREKHSWQSFQYPDKIAEAIRLISEIKLWDEVAKELGFEAKVFLKKKL